MSNIYQQKLLEHAKDPRNKKRLDNPTVTSDYSNPSCGDSIILDLKFEKNKLVAIGFEGEGCAISQASTSLLTEHIGGMSYDELCKIDEDGFWEILGIELSPTRQKCAKVSFNAFRNGLEKYNSLKKTNVN